MILTSSAIKSIIVILFFLPCTGVKAQVSSIQRVIDKLHSYSSFSYQLTDKRLDNTIDTTIQQNKDLFLKALADTTFGYLFKLENGDGFTNVYNGEHQFHLLPESNTYQIQKIQPNILMQTLPGWLNWIKNFAERKPSSLAIAADTIINGISNEHLILTTYDTIINNEHLYTVKHLLIDKRSDMPGALITISRNNYYGNGISDFYDEMRFADYQFNQSDVNAATFTVPKGYSIQQESAPISLLATGTPAPDWTLFDANGNKMTLSQMKGKIVLLDFYFIGCTGCMLSLKPLNTIFEKYKGKNVVIASISERDKQQAVLAFEKRYNIKYPGYINASGVVKAYHVEGFPTFYFIDQQGKIANVFVGYSDDFELKVTAIIDNLLDKN
jgi:peroxiredoxin